MSPSIPPTVVTPPSPVTSLARRVAAIAAIGLSAALCLGAATRAARHARPPLPTIGAVPALSMRDQRDRPVTERSLLGQINIVDFFFTSCPVSCPRLTARMAELEKTLSARHPKRDAFPVRLVSISVDPETDTPAKLAEYARRYGANDNRWWFLTGSADALHHVVVEGFKVSYQKADPALGIQEIMHGNWFVLVDAQGKIRGYYLSDDVDRLQALVEDAEQLARVTP